MREARSGDAMLTWDEGMVDLMLHEEQQGALRALMAAEPTRDCVVPGERLLAHLAVLLSCDLIVLAHLDAHGLDRVEATAQAQADWVGHVNARAQETLYPRATSYYSGDEVEGKPKVFMPYVGGVRGYRRILERVVAEGYSGFELTSSQREPAHARAGGVGVS